MARAKAKAQISMDDRIVKDGELEALLENRQTLKGGIADYRQADKDARKKIGMVSVEMPFRCGRFIISESMSHPGHVEFDKAGGTRLTIKTADE